MYMCVPAWVYMHHMPAEARKGHQSLGTGAVSNYVGDGNCAQVPRKSSKHS